MPPLLEERGDVGQRARHAIGLIATHQRDGLEGGTHRGDYTTNPASSAIVRSDAAVRVGSRIEAWIEARIEAWKRPPLEPRSALRPGPRSARLQPARPALK